MIRISSYFKFLLFTVLFFFIAINFSSAQSNLQDNTNKKIEEMMKKMTNKLLLTDVQNKKIESILKDYFSGIKNNSTESEDIKKLRSDSETKIINILDSKQKMKYGIIKDEWWQLASE